MKQNSKSDASEYIGNAVAPGISAETSDELQTQLAPVGSKESIVSSEDNTEGNGAIRHPPENTAASDVDVTPSYRAAQSSNLLFLVAAITAAMVGVLLNWLWLSGVGMVVTLILSLRVLLPGLLERIQQFRYTINPIALALFGLGVTVISWLHVNGTLARWQATLSQPNWDAVGALGEVFGALGQIGIALLAVWIAWRQYTIEKDLTTRQNVITQQQTIDTYFQGISDLVIDEEGLLEDWPQERAIAEGRTAAILSSVDNNGKAKILRFLSHSGLLTPLKRDRRLGRAILDGSGGYLEDRRFGIRVIDLRGMLANTDLAYTDLRWIDLSDANLVGANLSYCDLVKSNLSRTILYKATLTGADVEGVRFFYGDLETVCPRSRTEPPDFRTGACTGAVIEGVDFTNIQGLSEEQRCYCCAWVGSATRRTIPGGCEGIPNRLGR
jgi:uncharacterized protein YjbI with pentapeptide repeats